MKKELEEPIKASLSALKIGQSIVIKASSTPYEELKPERPDFGKMSNIEACKWHVAKYERLVKTTKDPKWKAKFKSELADWKSRLAHWEKKSSQIKANTYKYYGEWEEVVPSQKWVLSIGLDDDSGRVDKKTRIGFATVESKNDKEQYKSVDTTVTINGKVIVCYNRVESLSQGIKMVEDVVKKEIPNIHFGV